METTKAYGISKPVFNGPVLKVASSNSKLLERGPSPVSAKRIAAAHSAQMEATMAAVRADHDAKIAELMAELESIRGEKEKTDTDLAYLKATARKERLQWNKERTLLTRKVAEAEGRAREAGDGLASAQEFLTLQQALTSREATIRDLRRTLEAKEAQEGKLQFEVACASTAEADVDRLMVRVASLEKEIAKEGEAKIAAELEAEALSAEVKILQRKLNTAQEAVARAGEEVASCVQDVAKANAEVREAHAAQRHAELWLEKSLAEVDAVTAMLAYERSIANGVDEICAPGLNTSIMHTPLLQRNKRHHQQHTPLPIFHGHGDALDAAVTPKLEVASPVVDAAAEGSTTAKETPLSPTQPPKQDSNPRTPDLGTTTSSALFSTVRMHSRVGEGGRGGGSAGDDAAETETEVDGVGRQERGFCSPPTPTVLFGEPLRDGRSKARMDRAAAQDGEPQNWEIVHQNHAESPPAWGLESSVAPNSSATVVGGGMAALSGETIVQDAQDKENRANGKTASIMSLLLSETRKRVEAEARVAELERETAVAMAVAAASVSASSVDGETARGERTEMSKKSHMHRVIGSQARKSSGAGCTTAGDEVGGPSPCIHPHRSGDHGQLNSETYTRFAGMDQGRQRAKILGLVRDTRRKMQLLRKKEASASGGSDWGREFEKDCARDTEWTDGSDATKDESAWNGLDPASEVASLVHLLEGRLSQSVDANNQLRDFCAHLEGLLALHEGKREGVNSTSWGTAPSKSAGPSNHDHATGRLISPYAVCGEPLAKRRVGAQTSRSTPFPDVEINSWK